MSGDLDTIRRLQAAIRRESMRGSVEDALNALAAVSAEAIGTVPYDDRPKLFDIYGKMIQAALQEIHRTERMKVLPGLGAPLN